MANKTLFTSTRVPVRKADTTNRAGGKAYASTHKHALAQIAATNTFNGTFYASGEDNLNLAKQAVENLKDDPEFLAKVAIYSRKKGYMKDMPAYIVTWLAGIDTKLFRKAFREVVDNGKMLRNVIQMARSGQCGKKFNMSSGTWRNAISEWFENKPSWVIFKAGIGNDPSMRDMLRMARPKPVNKEKAALFAYLTGAELKDGVFRTYKRRDPNNKNSEKIVAYENRFEALPEDVQHYERYKYDKSLSVPKVDFRLLDSLGLGTHEWTEIARNAPWQMTRMNLNTFKRHGVFNNKELVKIVADRLRDKEAIVKARQFPYQLYTAWMATKNSDLPFDVSEALQDAMEIAVDNVPEYLGKIYVGVDCSYSMSSPVTGNRGYGHRSNTNVRCCDVAGLFASAIVRKNRNAEVYTFSNDAVKVELNTRDSVISNTQKLAQAGGGTNIASVLQKLNRERKKGDVVIYVSDNESWIDGGRYYYSGTALQHEWAQYKTHNKDAKLICIDITPSSNSQVQEHKDVLQVGGFSDEVFKVIGSFIEHGHTQNHWVSEIENVQV
jgi:60 kDa SS-A/Ro ribonucleoprotein